MDIATFEQIATVLSKLTVNYNNLFTEYYNLFYNPTPMDVTIQYYNEDGELDTIEIPNRAKDRRFILNGKGLPEGAISGAKGSIYQDTLNGDIYLKQFGSGISGWTKIVSSSELENFIKHGIGTPEGTFTAPKGVLYIDTQNASLYIKSTSTSSEGWILISASTNDLALRDLSNLSEVGEDHFANPSLSNLNNAGRAVLSSKENVNNKVTVLSEDCTDVQYPSARLLYDTIISAKEPLANRNLNNLTVEGEEHFLGKNRIREGILFAPSGISSISGNIVNVNQNTVLLMPDGRNSDGTLRNLRHVTYSRTVTIGGANYKGYVFYTSENSLITIGEPDIYSQSSQPSVAEGKVGLWWNERNNEYRIKWPNSSAWTSLPMTKLASYEVGVEGSLKSFTPKNVLSVSLEDDVVRVEDNLVKVEEKLQDDIFRVEAVFDALYPVGSLYMTSNNWCPMASVIKGSEWQIVATGNALWCGNGGNANSYIAAGLPQIGGYVDNCGWNDRCSGYHGAFSSPAWIGNGARFASEYAGHHRIEFYASRSNTIYGQSGTVQPPAYVVNVYRRIK